MSTTTIKCPKCKGTGKAPLTKKLTETLDALVQHPGSTAQELHQRLASKVVVAAINGRLEELRRLKLATRTQSERGFRYSPTQPNKTKQ